MSVVWGESLDVMLQLALWWSGRLTFPAHNSCVSYLSLLWQNTWPKQCKKEKAYFGSWFGVVNHGREFMETGV